MKAEMITEGIEIANGDCMDILKAMPDNSIDCVVTSPPYFNLRDYGIDGQLGLETNYKDYIDRLIAIFLEVKRVLKKSGTCFVNMGDTYNGYKVGNTDKKYKGANTDSFKKLTQKLPNKSLMMIPERFAIAMVENGWILRNKLVWIKPNAMPESVKDRWKKAHEYIFFFTKSPNYYFDLDSIRTPHKNESTDRVEYEQNRLMRGMGASKTGEKYSRNKLVRDGTERYYSMPARMVKLNPKGACPPDYLMVNPNSDKKGTRSHYAAYPEGLIKPLIMAGCPEGGVVLDPFMGSGTTLVVAYKLRRNAVGIEISEAYCELAKLRLKPLISQLRIKF